MITGAKKIEEILIRGVEGVVSKEHLKKRLLLGRPLRIKHGIDPTGPKIHIGRAAQFQKLKDFQELGHKIILVIGDFTAQIGDASDKSSMRQSLSEKEIRENMKNYVGQAGKILDIEKTEIRYNSEWLGKLGARDLLRLSKEFTAQQMIQRRNFKERWDQGKPIGLHELNYPLLQGYDSVAVKSDVELGGFDQLFNLKVGREIQKTFNQPPQDIMVLKMLFGPDGRKMSTSWGNVINITDDPGEQFGKIMSIKDELIKDYFELCTRVSLGTIKALPPREAKARLAYEIVKIYHSQKAAERAKREFEQVFKEKKLPSQIPALTVGEKELGILDLLVKTKLAPSKSEGKRLIEQKGVKIDGEVKKNWQETIKIKKGAVVQAGKRKFLKII